MKYRPAGYGGRLVYRQPTRSAQVRYLLQKKTGRRTFGYRRYPLKNYYKKAKYARKGSKTSRFYRFGYRYRR